MFAFGYNILYVPFSIGINFENEREYFVIDIMATIIFIIDSILRPFLAIN